MKTRATSQSSPHLMRVDSSSTSSTKAGDRNVTGRRFVSTTGYAPFILSSAIVLTVWCCSPQGHDEIVATSVGLQGKTVQALAIDPNNPSILYAGTDLYGVYKSVDAGATWNQATSGMADGNVSSLVVDPNVTTTLYAGTRSGGVFRSYDGASNWDAVNTGLTSPCVESLIVDPTDTATLYAGIIGGLFKTYNKGDNWSSASVGLPADDVQALAVNPSNTQELYAGMYYTGVYKSTDEGMSWTEANNQLDNLRIRALCIDPELTSTLYTGTDQLAPIDGTVYKSTDSGASWTKIPPTTGPTVLAIALDPNDHNKVFVGSWQGGAALSSDGGATWIISYRDSSLLGDVYDIAIDSVSSTVYAGTSNGVMKLTVEKLTYN